MRHFSSFADVQYDTETDMITRISTGEVLEDFNTPLWKGATMTEKRKVIDYQIKKGWNENAYSSSLDAIKH